MKNVWIIHNSKYGNSEKLSNDIAAGLKDTFDVKVGSIKTINPEEIAGDTPEALIIGGRIIAMSTDRKMTKFIKGLETHFKQKIPKIASFYTHGSPWKERFSKGLEKALGNSSCIGDLCPEILEVTIQGQKGPAVEGQDEKMEHRRQDSSHHDRETSHGDQDLPCVRKSRNRRAGGERSLPLGTTAKKSLCKAPCPRT